MCLNPPRLAVVRALIQAAMPLNSFVLISRGSTDTSNIFSPDFLDFFLPRCPHWTKTTTSVGTLWRATWEDVSDNHLFRCFFLSHRRFKGGTLWENKLWTAFPLRQPHNSLPVCGGASQRTGRLAGKIFLHLLTHTMASGDYRKWHTN